jgi:hypothetical protein
MLRRLRSTHIFDRDGRDHYVEPAWTAARLFEMESFGAARALVYDPCCGWGRVPHAAAAAGYTAVGSDVVDRSHDPYTCDGFQFFIHDFLRGSPPIPRPWSIVFNPPYSGDCIQGFVDRALDLARHKIAALVPLRRLPAAHWLESKPLETICLLTPRPSLPTGAYILAGNEPGGGSQDFAWLVFNKLRTSIGAPRVKWLHRDRSAP